MDDNTYGDEIIEQYFPYDGPHDDHTTTQAVRALAHLVRYLNNATGPWHQESALPYAATAYRVTSGLHSAVGSMPQLLQQLGKFFTAAALDPTLYDDRRRNPDAPAAGETAMATADRLLEAAQLVDDLGERLRRAAMHSGHLGNDEPPDLQHVKDVHNSMSGDDLG